MLTYSRTKQNSPDFGRPHLCRRHIPLPDLSLEILEELPHPQALGRGRPASTSGRQVHWIRSVYMTPNRQSIGWLETNHIFIFLKIELGEFSGGPVVRTVCFHCQVGVPSLVRGTKILQAVQHGQIKKKKKIKLRNPEIIGNRWWALREKRH